MIAHSSEFENIVVREEESMELITLRSKGCPLDVKGGPEDKHGKINVLIQVGGGGRREGGGVGGWRDVRAGKQASVRTGMHQGW